MTLEEIKEAVNNGTTVYYENRANFVDTDKDGEPIIVCNLTGFTSSLFRLDGTIGDESSFFSTEKQELLVKA